MSGIRTPGVERLQTPEIEGGAEEELDRTLRPQLAGIAVPGMPAGSPGMEMGEQQDAYQVIGLDRQGQEQVVSSYPGN